jgi:hypothetical protein
MWIFTENGFISAVADPKDPSRLAIRARDRESLDALVALTHQEVVTTPHGDYPYRIFVSPQEFASFVAETAVGIDYDNFKSRVAITRGYSYTNALHDVWAVMRGTEDDLARARDLS